MDTLKRHTTERLRSVSNAPFGSSDRTNLTPFFLASNPECAEGIMLWQHGTYSLEPNGSLVLKPFTSDGRQLLSRPCASDYATYTRYNQTEIFKVYSLFAYARKILINTAPIGVQGLYRSIPQRSASRFIPIRRHAHAAIVSRIQAPRNATDDDLKSHGHGYGDWEGKARCCWRIPADAAQEVIRDSDGSHNT